MNEASGAKMIVSIQRGRKTGTGILIENEKVDETGIGTVIAVAIGTGIETAAETEIAVVETKTLTQIEAGKG